MIDMSVLLACPPSLMVLDISMIPMESKNRLVYVNIENKIPKSTSSSFFSFLKRSKEYFALFKRAIFKAPIKIKFKKNIILILCIKMLITKIIPVIIRFATIYEFNFFELCI